MPRKDFIRDLQEASSDATFIDLKNVKPGEDDGTITCSFNLDGEEDVAEIQLLLSSKYFAFFLIRSLDCIKTEMLIATLQTSLIIPVNTNISCTLRPIVSPFTLRHV